MAVLDSLPIEYKDLPAKEFELNDGMMKIPFRINGNDRMLLFDTGSSPFQLVTSKERALEISDPQMTDSLSGPLWWGNNVRKLHLVGNCFQKPLLRIRQRLSGW